MKKKPDKKNEQKCLCGTADNNRQVALWRTSPETIFVRPCQSRQSFYSWKVLDRLTRERIPAVIRLGDRCNHVNTPSPYVITATAHPIRASKLSLFPVWPVVWRKIGLSMPVMLRRHLIRNKEKIFSIRPKSGAGNSEKNKDSSTSTRQLNYNYICEMEFFMGF